jgi:hypothetical protein
MRALLLISLVAACGKDAVPSSPATDPEAREEFPTLARLYDGDHGIYRGCGPNGNVCHNGNEFPNLDSIGSIVEGISRDCNQKRDKADAMHDMCERAGDLVEITLPNNAMEYIEIASITPIEGSGSPPREFQMVLRYAPSSFAGYQKMATTRDGELVANLGDLCDLEEIDPSDPSGRTIHLTMYAAPGGGEYDYGGEISKRLSKSGIPGDQESLHVGDPNRNGVFGAELGAKLIKPGDPQRSYLLRRLTDPSAGPLMPRANCCYWTKPALRALWCWVAGLKEDGSNALAPIDYDRCPPSPSVELDYPDPGPGCETAGRCPVVAIGGTGEPTFASIYSEVFVPKCGGMGCHDQEPFSGDVDLRDEQSAYESLQAKVVAGDPDASILAQMLTPATCQAPCSTMPLDRALLPDADVTRIRQWISDGALP